jgi:methylated-DNA-[protein]-cysteine S-methyltransferase
LAPSCWAYQAPGWGVGELWLDGDVVVWHELPAARQHVREAARGKGFGDIGSYSRRGPNRHPGDTLLALLRAYFAGEPVEFGEVAVDLGEETAFGRSLAAALRSVPRGEVVTYGELAALAGRPGAARAAGTFCARNRVPLFVPCHRVVSADGLGSYGSLGVEYKRRLLALEEYPGCR